MKFIFLGVGVLIGSLSTMLIGYVKPVVGTLRIDHSNPEKDTYDFHINNLDGLSKKKRITLKVDNNADLSQN